MQYGTRTLLPFTKLHILLTEFEKVGTLSLKMCNIRICFHLPDCTFCWSSLRVWCVPYIQPCVMMWRCYTLFLLINNVQSGKQNQSSRITLHIFNFKYQHLATVRVSNMWLTIFIILNGHVCWFVFIVVICWNPWFF